MQYLIILISAIFINNIVVPGICPISCMSEPATAWAWAVRSSLDDALPTAHPVAFGLPLVQTTYILVIAFLVQVVEIIS